MQYLIAFLLILVGIALAFMAAWIVLVFIARLFVYILGYAILVACLTFVIGLIWGFVVCCRAARGHGTVQAKVATPEAIAQGEVFRSGPRGAAEHFGWDTAWPLYVPYQLRFDIAAVMQTSRAKASAIVSASHRKWPKGSGTLGKVIGNFTWFCILGFPTLGLAAGLLVATGLWWIVVTVFRLLVTITQRITTLVMRGKERRFTKKYGTETKCMHCYGVFSMPSYACSGCGKLHRDVSPGPLGIRTRICECETVLPLTRALASKSLTAHCPYCDDVLPLGTGTRRIVSIPVFGSVGTGKTQFLATALTALIDLTGDAEAGLQLLPLSDEARAFAQVALTGRQNGAPPEKTAVKNRPEGLPFLLTRGGEETELQLMDAAGEQFTGSQESTSLAYFDSAGCLIFLVDPLTFPEVHERLQAGPRPVAAQVASGSLDDAYGSVVDRLRDAGQNLQRRQIAIVLTKTDIVNTILPGEPIPTDSAGVREWLLDHGGDGLVRRSELDFDGPLFFAVDSTNTRDPHAPQHPLHVVDWTITAHQGAPLFPPEPRAPETGQEQPQLEASHE